VIFVVDSGMHTLMDFRYRRHYKAESGQNGGTAIEKAETVRICISKFLPAQLSKILKRESPGRFTISRPAKGIGPGGSGGKGNARFATSTRQAPKFAQPGHKGEERWVFWSSNLLPMSV